MRINKQEYQELQAALISAFPDSDDLKKMVRFELDENLEAIAKGKDLSAVVFNLIEVAETRGKLPELITGAYRANSGNPELKAFYQKYPKITQLINQPSEFLENNVHEYRYLPYLLNRQDQESGLKLALNQRITTHLLVCIIHGDRFQSHETFLGRMQKDILPNLLGLNQENATINKYNVLCHSKLTNMDDLLRDIIKEVLKLKSASIDIKEMNEIFNQFSSPVIVCINLATDDWKKPRFDINELLKSLQNWHNHSAIAINEKIIICISIEYIYFKLTWELTWKFISSFFKHYKYQRINKKIRKYIQEISSPTKDFNSLSVVVLPELKAIERSDVLRWCTHEYTKKFLREDEIQIQKLKDKTGDMFDDWEKQNKSDKISMRDLADELLKILKQFESTRRN